MDALTWFGLLSVTAMLVFYELEKRSPWFILAFAASCATGSIYGFRQGAWPFGIVEAVWSVVAARRWWFERTISKRKVESRTETIPVACSLSDPELRKREATLLAQFKSAVTATEELGDGYAFHVPGDDKWLTVVSELMVSERQCCPFLTFELIAQPNAGPLILRMTGPTGTKEFLKSILIER